MPEPPPLKQILARRIAAEGGIGVDDYMAASNAHYYATRDPFGATGDFVTAPEISQMFGEIVGLWLADLWARAGRPQQAQYVELGPGRGTLAADARRAMRSARFEPRFHFVETSPILRRMQAERLPEARWHESLAGAPRKGPLLVVANEFFDALPVRQRVATARGWCERRVGFEEGRFVPMTGGPAEPPHPVFEQTPEGAIFESSPISLAIADALARRVATQGGAALIIDYGHERSALGETLQAVRAHAFADPWAEPGECDLTAHVNFGAIAGAARARGLAVAGPVGQGDWLRALGIDLRAAALATAQPGRAADIEAARQRLTRAEAMGRLFKAMALVAPGWPAPAGF